MTLAPSSNYEEHWWRKEKSNCTKPFNFSMNGLIHAENYRIMATGVTCIATMEKMRPSLCKSYNFPLKSKEQSSCCHHKFYWSWCDWNYCSLFWHEVLVPLMFLKKWRGRWEEECNVTCIKWPRWISAQKQDRTYLSIWESKDKAEQWKHHRPLSLDTFHCIRTNKARQPTQSRAVSKQSLLQTEWTLKEMLSFQKMLIS